MATPDQELAARIAYALLVSDSPEEDIARILGAGDTPRAVARLLTTSPGLPAPGVNGPASNAQAIENLILKGFYAVNATRRIEEAQDKEAAIAKEATHHAMHLGAITKRSEAALAVDEAATRYGPVLSWRAVLDESTTPECREAHGKNFRADTRPSISWPGATHPRCRCTVGPPVRGAADVG